MKKIIKCLFVVSCAFMCMIVIPVHAATASGEDDNVQYTYWDQSSIHTYWSGVYNKINYNNYKPCIASTGIGGGGCGDTAWQSQYVEHSEKIYVWGHYHYLLSYYGTEDYKVE